MMALNGESIDRANPHPGDWTDVEEIKGAVDRYLSGALSDDEFRHFRVMRGIYSQRQPGVHMVRVRVPLGQLTAPQARRLAALSREFGHGKVHVTTRQDIQLHHVPTRDVPKVVHQLALSGLTTRESGGSSTRNVTVCQMAGVCPNENTDVGPLAEAVGAHFLRHPLVQNLPRKFKVAFSGCERDCAQAGINDAGFIARPEGGFRMMAAGGLGATPEAAFTLDEQVPPEEVLPMTEAVVRVFDRLGDRTNRQRARLKFVARRIGQEALRDEIRRERVGLSAAPPELTLAHQAAPLEPTSAEQIQPSPADGVSPLPGYHTWKQAVVVGQRQQGFYTVKVFVPCGDLSHDQVVALADAAERYGDGIVRTTIRQGVLLSWVPEDSLPALHLRLAEGGLAGTIAGTLADIMCCPASATCRLGVTRATDAAGALTLALEPLAHDADLKPASVKVSGCPNSCAHHHTATIGLHGAAATVNGRKVPCYQVFVGGKSAHGVALGRRLAKVPARRIGEAVLRLFEAYRTCRAEGETPWEFFQRVETAWLNARINDLADLQPRAGEENDFFVDLGDTGAFHMETADGECAA